jgi:hypothetical protein
VLILRNEITEENTQQAVEEFFPARTHARQAGESNYTIYQK